MPALKNPVILYGGLPVLLSTALEDTRLCGESYEPEWENGGQKAVDAFIMARGRPDQDETDLPPLNLEEMRAACGGRATPLLRQV